MVDAIPALVFSEVLLSVRGRRDARDFSDFQLEHACRVEAQYLRALIVGQMRHLAFDSFCGVRP